MSMRFQRKLGGAKPPVPAPRKGNPLSPMSTERNSLERTRKAYFDGSDVDPPLPPPHQMARKRRFHLANASDPTAAQIGLSAEADLEPHLGARDFWENGAVLLKAWAHANSKSARF